MKVVIVGAGVIGVTSAWYLAKAGHEVVVVDRQPGPARETSFANAGEVSFGYCSPWAAPGVPLKAMHWLFMEHAPLILRLRPDGAMLGWLLRMLVNCTDARYALNKSRMLRIAEYSRVSLKALRDETGIAYDQRMQGTLQLFRKPEQLEAAYKDIAALAKDGIPHELLNAGQCAAVEPGLGPAVGQIAGGLRTPLDETGDCYRFTEALAGKAAEIGVTFRYGETIERLEQADTGIAGVRLASGTINSDAVLVAAGSYSPALVRPLGIRLPVYPVKGYSLTLPVEDESRAPQSTVLDESYKVAITRLGQRIRVGGMAEISGYTSDLPEARRRTLVRSVTDLFPAGDTSRAQFWSGLRPMTPDGTPVIGPTAVKGLYLNTGHGTLGWTMSTGSGRLIADIIGARPTDIQSDDLGMARYG